MTLPCTARPLRADAARNREKVLQAAREVFAERGMDVTLDDIARHAGLGTGTVYRRFASKQELVEALFQERIAHVTQTAERCLADPDPWSAFEQLVRTTCAQLAQDRGLRQVMSCSSYGLDQVARARAKVLPIAEQIVARATAAGVLRPEVTAADVPMVFLMVGAVVDFSGDVTPGLWSRYLTFVLDGMRAGHPAAGALPGPLEDAQLVSAMSDFRPAGRR